VNIGTNGAMTLNGATPTWADYNIHDEALRQLVKTDLTDNVLNRAEILAIFKQVEKDGTLNSVEFTDLKAIANTSTLFATLASVGVLPRDVGLGNAANKSYGGATLGNLAAGWTSAQMDKLVGKWFLGTDHPNSTISGTTFTYTVAAGKLFGTNGPQY